MSQHEYLARRRALKEAITTDLRLLAFDAAERGFDMEEVAEGLIRSAVFLSTMRIGVDRTAEMVRQAYRHLEVKRMSRREYEKNERQ